MPRPRTISAAALRSISMDPTETRPRVFRISVTRTSSSSRYLRELVAGQIEVHPALVGQRLLPALALVHGVDRVDQRLLLRIVDAGGRHHRAPVGELDIDALLLEGRDVEAFDPRRRGDRQRAQLAGLDLAQPFADAADAGGHVAAHDRRQRFAAAGERHVVELGRIGARGLRDQAGQDVVGAAGRAAAPGDRADVGLQLLDQLAESSGCRTRPEPR